MNRTVFAILFVLGAAGCKKGGTKDSQETLDRLTRAEEQLAANATLIQQLQADNARLATEAGGVLEWKFTIENDILVIGTKPGRASGGSGGGVLDDATATAMSQEFVNLVNKSKSQIQRCYEQVLKKSPTLQGRTVPLRITASFAAAGSLADLDLNSGNIQLPAAFDECIDSLASGWKLPPQKYGSTHQAPIKLTPT